MIDILLVVHLILAVLMIIVILMQKSGADGLGGLGGGGGGLVTARATANFLTRTTVVLAVLFMTNAIVLANLSGKKKDKVVDAVEKELERDAVPMAK